MSKRWWLAVSLFASGCFAPEYPTNIPCSENQTCPPGQTCDLGGICRLMPQEPDAAVLPGADAAPDAAAPADAAIDARVPDAAPPDAPAPRCGDGKVDVELLEVCDDGNTTDGDGCSADCRSDETCGNEIVDVAVGEACEEGGVNTPTCDADCTRPVCGDRLVNTAANEECDDGNIIDGDGCSSACKKERVCGNGTLDAGEDVDPPPGPSQSVPADALTCRYDFSSISQLYCDSACGNWGGGDGCQQADADALCKLKTDNPNSSAISFDIVTALRAPGICCPPPTLDDPGLLDCVQLGALSDRGVSLVVSVHDTDLRSTHGAGLVVTNVVCTDP